MGVICVGCEGGERGVNRGHTAKPIISGGGRGRG